MIQKTAHCSTAPTLPHISSPFEGWEDEGGGDYFFNLYLKNILQKKGFSKVLSNIKI